MQNFRSHIENLKGRVVLRKVLGNTLWQLTDKIARMLLGLVVGIWIARYLGPHQFGMLNFAIAFVALFSPFADIGLQAVLVRELVRRPEARAQIVASGLLLRLAGAGVAVCLACLSIALTRPTDVESQLLVLAVALSFWPQAWDVIDFDYQARMHPRPMVAIRTISLVAFSILKIAFIIGEAKVIWFAIAIAGEAGLSALWMRWLFARQAPRFSIAEGSLQEAKHLLANSWPMALAGLSVVLYMRIDQVMLGQLLSDEMLGIFSAAVRISESWYLIPMAIAVAVAPVLTAAHQESEEQYNRKLVLLIRAVLLASIVIGGLLAFWSDAVVGLLYGDKYDTAGSVLVIHAWAGIFAGLGVATGPWFVNAGLLKYRMVHTLAGAGANVALNYYLIPRFGVQGAAVSTLISYSLAAFWLNALNKRTIPIFQLQLRALLMR